MKRAAFLLAVSALSACSSSAIEVESYSKLAVALKKDFPDICVERSGDSSDRSKIMNCTPDSDPQRANFFLGSGSGDDQTKLVTLNARFSANLPGSDLSKYGDFYRKTVGKFPFGSSILADKFNNLDALVSACFATRPNDTQCELDNESTSYPGGVLIRKGSRQTMIVTIAYKRAGKSSSAQNGEIVQPSDCEKGIISSYSGDILVSGTLSVGKLNTDRISKGSLQINGKDYNEEFRRVCNK